MPLDSPDTQGVSLNKPLAAALEPSSVIRGCLKEKQLENFNGFGLAAPLVNAVTQMGYSKPTPIQAQAIPALMAGRDLIGIAQTGTGKTAAFALPILNHLLSHPRPAPRGGARVLVLSPTRELASQIAQSFRDLSAGQPFAIAVVFGGVPHGAQIKALAKGLDVLVATPGRLVDHMDARVAQLRDTEFFVLDEVDQMLDLGFVKSIRRVVRDLPKQRQNLFFSATMPPDIRKLAGELLRDPLEIAVTPVAKTADRVEQQVIFVDGPRKRDMLVELFKDEKMSRTLVFTRTKRGAQRLARELAREGFNAAMIHGDRSQSQRNEALSGFQEGRFQVLVATDIASRGLHVDDVAHVVNYDLPKMAEDFIHRVGRTGRAGNQGRASSIVTGVEVIELRNIERTLKLRMQRMQVDPAASDQPRRVIQNTLASRTLTRLPGEVFV